MESFEILSPHGRRSVLGGGETRLMGVLNVTPDSFSDGGRFLDVAAAVTHAERMVEAGAAVLDVGGESTRPGHSPVPAEEQIRRVLPVLEAVRPRVDVPISIDTTRAAVAAAALDAGADWVNDTSALGEDPDLAVLVAERRCPIVLMHRFEPPRPARSPADRAQSVLDEILATLGARIARACEAGISRERILVDPGLGFGTLFADNLTILAGIDRLRGLGRPLVVGPSRKSFLGQITGRPVHQRLWGTAGAVAALALSGVELVRVHDVAEMLDVARVADAIRRAGANDENENRS